MPKWLDGKISAKALAAAHPGPSAPVVEFLDSQHTLAFQGKVRTATTVDGEDLGVSFDKLMASGGIEAEFTAIRQHSERHVAPTTASLEPDNMAKNRYKNILAIDNTRVLLSHTGISGSDYINANYMDGWNKPRAYIASQGPLPGTVPDFWRMVWEQGSSVVVMLTKEVELAKTKCHCYFPQAAGECLKAGQLEVAFVSFDYVTPDYAVRTLNLVDSATGKQRTIYQYVYLTWPDQNVPEQPVALLEFVKDVRARNARARLSGAVGPVVIHCSAGIGRTGAFAVLDINMQRLSALGNVDVNATLSYLREQRAGAVQTLVQYAFCYEALAVFAKTPGLQSALGEGPGVPRTQLVPTRAQQQQLHTATAVAPQWDAPTFHQPTAAHAAPAPAPAAAPEPKGELSRDEMDVIAHMAGPDDPRVSNAELVRIMDSM
jgi:protein tyrosine phosphatase